MSLTKERVLEEFKSVPPNTLIFASKLYREKFSREISETAFAQIVSRLYRNKEIERLSKGVYYCPLKTRFGSILPSDKEIISTFTEQNNGMVVGYGLYNSLSVTTQISKRQIAYSSVIDEKKKSIRDIIIYKHDLTYTTEIKAVIVMLELLKNYRDIQEINHYAFLNCLQSLSDHYNDETFEKIQKTICYPKRSIAFLREVLNYYGISNYLSYYLSEFSDYQIPKMEELYEKIIRK